MSTIIFVAAVAGVIGVIYYLQKLSREKFFRVLENDDDVFVEPLPDDHVEVRTKKPHHAVTMTSAGGGKNDPMRWVISARAPRIAERIGNLVVSEEGLLDALREKLGNEDIKTGDELFDKTFLLRGDDNDVVRGIFSRAGVRNAVRKMFRAGVTRFEISNGDVKANASRSGFSIESAKNLALATARCIELLEENADAEPAREPMRLAATSVEGSSVVVPVGERER
jgi:hypothetical protein